MNHINDLENLEDPKAARRERKKRPRMRVHGRSLKQTSTRGIKHIVKIERKKKR